MIATQLEPADARRIFPCWDEPAFKASFELAVTVPQAFTAVGNMPVTREEAAGPGAKRVSFAPTPRMSSYLFVLAAGEFERLTEEADGVTVSVVTTLGKREQGRFALESAIRLLHYFNDYFGVKYPLPKLDLIGIPGGFSGAMENWGGITFCESLLLFDPATSAPAARRRIFGIIAHEIAHQWFGDLVTMGWWDNIWLNEGFASWMQTKASEHFFPQWQSWLNGSDRKQGAMNVDARRTSHPIQRTVTNELEASAAFDSITYSKGQALIRMLEDYLGEDVFRAGIRRYMRDHAFGNTTTADLWRALETASGQPIASIAAAYTEQAGLPLVLAEAVCRDGEQRIVLRQERFTLRDPDAAPHRWQVPIAYGPLRTLPPARLLLVPGETREIAAGRCGDRDQVQPRRRRLLPCAIRCHAARRAGEIAAADGAGGPGQSDRRHLGAGGGRPHAGRLLLRTGRGNRQRRQPRGVGSGDARLQPDRLHRARPARPCCFPRLCPRQNARGFRAGAAAGGCGAE